MAAAIIGGEQRKITEADPPCRIWQEPDHDRSHTLNVAILNL
jgi:hypothetical protein